MSPEEAAQKVHMQPPVDGQLRAYLAYIVQKEIDENGEDYLRRTYGTFRETWRLYVDPAAVFTE